VLKQIHWKHYLIYAMAAAIVYCIPVALYLIRATFTQAWLLYLGNFLFLIVVIVFLFSFNRQRGQNASTVSMLVAGHITVVMGIIVACILGFILLVIFVPGYLDAGTTEKVLSNAPANTIKDKTEGLSFMLFANALIGNVSAGSAACIIFPFTLKRDQTHEKVPHQQAEL
jgi:hypothetical protein